MKLEKLTSKQKRKMYEVRDFWLNYIFSCKNSQINKESAKIGIEWLYELSNLNKPIIIYVDSPLGCQFAVKYLEEFLKQTNKNNNGIASVGDSVGASVWDSVQASVGDSVGASVGDSVGASVWDSVQASVQASVWVSVGASVQASVGASVRASVRASVGDSVGDSVGASVQASVWDSVQASGFHFEQFADKGSIFDYGWVSFYDFFKQIGIVNNGNFDKFQDLLLSGVYDMVQLKGFCIVSSLPSIINRNERGRLHCENGPAIKFNDGYEIYFWNGIEIPKEWIINKSSITKEVITKETNAEKRRCLQEILGGEQFTYLLECKVVDEDVDVQGNVMKLLKTKTKDNIINEHIYYYKCVCPSTKREYVLCVPECKNVWEAKAWTFNNQKIEIRHGDVGLININNKVEFPIYES